MKKLLVLLAGLMLVSSLCAAGADPDPDSMGIFFDTDATVYEYFTAAPFQAATAYLVVSNPTSRGVSGWECMVDIVATGAGVVAPVWAYEGGGMNMGDPALGLFNVGVGPGPGALVPINDVVVLASYTAYVMDPTVTVTFTVLPFPGSVTFDDAPGYVDADDVGVIYPCGVSTGYPYGAVCAAINMDPSGIIPNSEMTWSGVKALFD